MDSQLSTHQSELNVSKSFEDEFKSKILQILELNDSLDSKTIVKHLEINGRQHLRHVKDEKILPEIFEKQMASDQSELLDILKTYFEKQWQDGIYEQWFKDFLAKQKDESPVLYDDVLTRFADNRSKYIENNEILSLTIQFLFKFNDKEIDQNVLFNEIWNKLISEGRQGIKHYQEYIPANVLDNQLNDDQSPLFLALKNYYHSPLKKLLDHEQVKVSSRNVFEAALDSVANYGWRHGLHKKKITNLIAQINFENLERVLEQYLDKNQKMISGKLPSSTNEKEIPSTNEKQTPPTNENQALSKSQNGIVIRINLQLFLLFL
jgi:hypothetical protein